MAISVMEKNEVEGYSTGQGREWWCGGRVLSLPLIGGLESGSWGMTQESGILSGD